MIPYDEIKIEQEKRIKPKATIPARIISISLK